MNEYTRPEDHCCPFCGEMVNSVILHLENEECEKITVSAKSLLGLKKELDEIKVPDVKNKKKNICKLFGTAHWCGTFDDKPAIALSFSGGVSLAVFDDGWKYYTLPQPMKTLHDLEEWASKNNSFNPRMVN
jgi:hypothetical protein